MSDVTQDRAEKEDSGKFREGWRQSLSENRGAIDHGQVRRNPEWNGRQDCGAAGYGTLERERRQRKHSG